MKRSMKLDWLKTVIKYILEVSKAVCDSGKVCLLMIKTKYIKEISRQIISMDMESKSTQMATYILETLRKTKSMEKVNFIGLVCPRQ